MLFVGIYYLKFIGAWHAFVLLQNSPFGLKKDWFFNLVSAMSFVVTINITCSTPRLEEVQIWAHHD